MCVSVCLSVCVSHYSSKTTGCFELKFGVKMRLAPVDVLNMSHELDLKVKITARLKVKLRFIAISRSIFELGIKCKTGVSLTSLAIEIKHFQNYATSGLRTRETLKIFSPLSQCSLCPCDIS